MRQEMRLTLDPRDTKDRAAEAVNGGPFQVHELPGMLEGLPERDPDTRKSH